MTDTQSTLVVHLIQAVVAIAALTWMASDHLISGTQAMAAILAAAGITTASQLLTNVQQASARALAKTTDALVSQNETAASNVGQAPVEHTSAGR